MLYLLPNMLRLNPNAPNHTDFVEITPFIYHVTIDRMTIVKSPWNQFKEGTQDQIAENVGKNDLFQFLGNKIDPQIVKNLSENYNFKNKSDKFRNLSASNKMHVHWTLPAMTPKNVWHLHS